MFIENYCGYTIVTNNIDGKDIYFIMGYPRMFENVEACRSWIDAGKEG